MQLSDNQRKHIKKLVDRLFTSVTGEKAARLVLVSPDGRDLGFWWRDAVEKQIIEELERDARARRKP